LRIFKAVATRRLFRRRARVEHRPLHHQPARADLEERIGFVLCTRGAAASR
jgi:hypothetical protein